MQLVLQLITQAKISQHLFDLFANTVAKTIISWSIIMIKFRIFKAESKKYDTNNEAYKQCKNHSKNDDLCYYLDLVNMIASETIKLYNMILFHIK